MIRRRVSENEICVARRFIDNVNREFYAVKRVFQLEPQSKSDAIQSTSYTGTSQHLISGGHAKLECGSMRSNLRKLVARDLSVFCLFFFFVYEFHSNFYLSLESNYLISSKNKLSWFFKNSIFQIQFKNFKIFCWFICLFVSNDFDGLIEMQFFDFCQRVQI